MRNLLYTAISITLALQACLPLERELSRGQVVGWDKRAKSEVREPGKPKDKTKTYQIWTALVEYPEGYDWRLNAEWRSVESKIHLLCNGEERLCFSSGPKGTGDAENNIIMDGHIYCFKANDRQTIISKDSLKLISYPSREFIKGFLIKDGEIWTLGAHRGQDGFALRKGGKEVLSRDEGNISGGLGEAKSGLSGALYEDRGRVCFCYNVWKKDKRIWYTVQDGVESELSSDFEIMDACMNDAKLHRIEAGGAIYGERLIVEGEQWIPPRAKQEGNAFDLGFVRGGRDIAISAKNLNRRTSKITLSLWYKGERKCCFEEVETILFNGESCVGISNSGKGNLKIKTEGKEMDFGNCYLASERCVAFDPRSGGVYVAATSEGGGAFVARNEEIISTFKVNGYVSSIEVREIYK